MQALNALDGRRVEFDTRCEKSMSHKDGFVTWVGGNRGMANVTARFLREQPFELSRAPLPDPGVQMKPQACSISSAIAVPNGVWPGQR